MPAESTNPSKRQRLDEASIRTSVPANSSSMTHVQCTKTEEKPEWDHSATTMTVPDLLPMQYLVRDPRFYVRDCYPLYYEMLRRLLKRDELEAATITGTPGIGKSVFFAYFFQRYSFENEKMTIITASFQVEDNKSKMKKVAVWKGGQVLGHAEDDKKIMNNLIWETKTRVEKEEAERREKGVDDFTERGLLYLYDGPPKSCPSDAKVVCFTSPNDSWFNKYLRKSPGRVKLIMPLWDLEELQTAAEEVNITLDIPLVDETRLTLDGRLAQKPPNDLLLVDEVARRFRIFGGVARECLATDEGFVERRQNEIEKTICRFEDVTYMRSILERSDRTFSCHYIPNPGNPQKECTLAEPTTFVNRLLMERMKSVATDKRNAMIDCLRDGTASASFRGTLFEMGVHEKLSSGCTITAEPLSGDNLSTFECQPSTSFKDGECVCYFDNNFTASILSSGPYHVPSAKTFASIDSFYYPTSNSTSSTNEQRWLLWLFVVTMAEKHPVNGLELTETLQKLDLFEVVKNDPTRLALIFVVPRRNAQSFGPQTIMLGTASDTSAISVLGQIGKKREQALNDAKIFTIGDLRKRLEKEERANTNETTKLADKLSVKTLRRMLKQHDKKKELSGLEPVFNAIPQFVWGADLDPKHWLGD
ncbi:hypothetical protein PR001_g12289 [Phytophthora rubi]|uniref:Uncharacterized protein n=1 Tax=Phytophthora rubi TaxID=129364 RepID=A0A6A3M317_9STRA|nr:hypothetical protein PR002_g11223 [Phytophthora rubi]KAE9026016.1 hypothetical protein PR001_g12289 [Phytophthora rubi]